MVDFVSSGLNKNLHYFLISEVSILVIENVVSAFPPLSKCTVYGLFKPVLSLRIARLKAKQTCIRRDFAHKASHALCAGTQHQAIAFENLHLKNMTAAPETRPNEQGGYERNGAAAKAGINASLLRWGIGLIRQFTAYKAPRVGKHFVIVPAAYSSQECSCCHYTSPLNRKPQAGVCLPGLRSNPQRRSQRRNHHCQKRLQTFVCREPTDCARRATKDCCETAPPA